MFSHLQFGFVHALSVFLIRISFVAFLIFLCFDVLISGLQVVVAQFHRKRRIGGLCAGILRLLLCHQTEDHRAGADSHVFRLHCAYGSHILAADRYNRFLRRVRLHQEDIRGRQDRLVKIIISRVMRTK